MFGCIHILDGHVMAVVDRAATRAVTERVAAVVSTALSSGEMGVDD